MTDSTYGRNEYIRFDSRPNNPGTSLNNRTLHLIAGGFIDIVVSRHSENALGSINYTTGMEVKRQTHTDREVYRISIPLDSKPGEIFTLRCGGTHKVSPFILDIKCVK